MWIYVLGINAKWWGIVIAGYAHFVLVFFFLAKETYDAFVMLKVGEASFSAVAVFPSQP